MALSMNSPIRMDDIEDAAVLRSGTVYLLTGLNGEKLVVKSEAANLTKASFGVSKTAMKSVDAAGGASKALLDAEKAMIRLFAEGMRDVIDFMTEHRIPGAKPSEGVTDLLANFQQNPHALWYKMPFQNVTDLKGALTARMSGTPDKNPMKAFAEALSAKGGLEALGRIIACDLFIGNQDRVNPNEGSNLIFGNRRFDFKVIKNVSNVFLGGTGTAKTPTGMDFIDPGTGYRHYDMTLNEVKETYVEDWLGDWLVDRKLRKEFCGKIVEDLELILTPNRKSYSPFTKLGRSAASRIEKGMVEGARLLLTRFEQKYAVKAAPAGMKSRLDKLRAMA